MKAKFNLPKKNLCANFNMPDCSMSASFEMSNGTKNYEKLENKPSINGVELIGNKTSADLGLATAEQGALAESALQEVPSYYVTETELASELSTKQNVISDLSEIREGASLGATSVQPDDISGMVTSVNGVEPINGNVTIEVPQQVNADWNATSGVAKILNKPTIPTDTGDLTNNAGYIKGIGSADVINALGYIPYDSSNPDGYTSNKGTVTSVNGNQPDNSGNVVITIPDSATWGNITGTLSNQTDLQNALNAKVNSSSLATVATSGSYNDLSNKPTIGNGTITLSQGGVNKGSFNLNDTGNKTINLDAGGGSGNSRDIFAVHTPSSKVFQINTTTTAYSVNVYNFSNLLYLDYVIKTTTGNPYGSEEFGIQKDSNNFIRFNRNGYSAIFTIKIGGSIIFTQNVSSYVDNISGFTELLASFDFERKLFVVKCLRAGIDVPVEKARIDFSAYDISALSDFKIVAQIGRYSANVYSESVFINNKMNYVPLLAQHYNINAYNSLKAFDNSQQFALATSLSLGSTTETISATHKIATVNRTSSSYYAMGCYGSYTGSSGLNIVKFKVYDVETDPVFSNGAGLGEGGLRFFDYDTGEYVSGSGFTPIADKWYLLVINMGSGVDYTRNYSVALKGVCKIEAIGMYIIAPQSINLCAETYSGKYFTGTLPFSTGNAFFTDITFNTTQTGRSVPRGALVYASNGGISMYNGTAWKAIAS